MLTSLSDPSAATTIGTTQSRSDPSGADADDRDRVRARGKVARNLDAVLRYPVGVGDDLSEDPWFGEHRQEGASMTP